MLRKIRIALAGVFFIGITLLFIGIGQQWWGWMAKLQFLPSCLALNVAVIVGILLFTVLFGRVYCSVICPLGVFQDCVNRLSSKRKGKSRRFKFHKENRALRDLALALFLLALMFDVQWFVVLLAPYSAYGRMVRAVVDPSSTAAVTVAAVTFAVIFLFAWVWGREWCNSICPVGTVLSLFSRFSLFRPVIDEDKCVHCHECERKCKASCIDSFDGIIDRSRCVDCFDCIADCKAGAIKYRFYPSLRKKKEEPESSGNLTGEGGGRRSFIATAAFMGGAALAAKAQEKHLDGGLAEVVPKREPVRTERLVPFGAGSVKDFYDRCTGCQLCVSACPNGVLRPSTDLQHLMQPYMGYEKGWCRPECTACSDVCPTGAIIPVEKEMKLVMSIGKAAVNLDLCIAAKGEDSCGNCARHCPVGAILMVRNPDAPERKIPTLIEQDCTGCGACEFLCPSRPVSAITVNGCSVHYE